MRSNLPTAIDFQDWVMEEVLPSIRKTGLFAPIPFKSNGLVSVMGGELWVSALDVANVFTKEHYDVLRSFEQALREEKEIFEDDEEMTEKKRVSFKAETIMYIDLMNRQQSTYMVNRPLFNYVVLNYTGHKANKYRFMFIQEFEEMDKMLRVMATKQMIYKNQNKQSVYIFKNELTGLVKVGVSDNPEKRMKTLSNQSGCPLQMVYNTPKCKNAYDVERSVHSALKQYRKVGEWFDVSENEVFDILEKHSLDFGSGMPLLNVS